MQLYSIQNLKLEDFCTEKVTELRQIKILYDPNEKYSKALLKV